jgi:peptidoglycan/LPS O-acetylase OafA/YrhL
MPQEKQYPYRPEIDGLRAFAVTAVIVNHFNKELLPNGYLGVDIFFVISGFVITASMAGRPSENLRDFLIGFYSRRVKRLVPALILFVLISSVLICLFNPSPGASLETGMAALLGLSNLHLLQQSTDYFAPSTELNVFTHTWSLGVEEQFYVLFPFLVWFTGFGRQSSQGVRNLLWVMGFLSIASVIAFGYAYKTYQPAAYFLMPTRLWELGAGSLLVLSLKRFHRFLGILEWIPSWLVVAAIAAVLLAPAEFALPATLLVVALTVVLIGCLRPGTIAYRLLTHPKVVYIGLISYSLYLWHWGVLSLSRWTIGIHWWSVPFQIALMVLLAIASYRYIETPLRRSDWAAVRWKSIGYGLGSSAISAWLISLLNTSYLAPSYFSTPNRSLYTGQKPSIAAVGVSSLTRSYSLNPVQSIWRGSLCALSDNSQVGRIISVENCTVGKVASAKQRVMVFGDSFSAAFTQAFDDLVLSDGYSVTIVPCWSASPIKEVPNHSVRDQINNYYWDTVVPTLIDQLKSGDWVFLASDMAQFSPKVRMADTTERLQQFESGLKILSEKLAAKGIHLAVLNGLPFAREANCPPIVAAKQWFSPFGGPCKLPNRTESLRRHASLNDMLVSLESSGKLRIVNLFDIFCAGEQCTYNAMNGQFLYRDEFSHPSIEAVRLSAPIIRQVLTSP